eukprot:tig00000630_g2691.t1
MAGIRVQPTRVSQPQPNPDDVVVCFDISKRETHHPAQGFKQMCRKLKFKITTNKDEITPKVLSGVHLFVMGGPTDQISSKEFETLKGYLNMGGSVLLFLGEGGEGKFGTNVNFLLEEYGIMVNNDAVIRTVYYKYLHPKEVFINDGVVNRAITKAVNNVHGKTLERSGSMRVGSAGASKPSAENVLNDDIKGGVTFVYPYGATLSVQKPAIPILATGQMSYPLNRPIAAVSSNKQTGKGRLLVLGSVRMFDDQFLELEENSKLMDVLFRWLLGSDGIEMNSVDADDPDINEYHHVPDTGALAERLRCCLQESEELPRDFTTLYDEKLFKFDTSLIPEAVTLYERLGVKHEPLTLIPPQFETPLPALQPAVFPPALREPPPPALDLFDLDEHFASEKSRMATLSNKCTEADLEYYIRESGEILGVTHKLAANRREAKHILEYVFTQLVQWKKLNQDQALE